MKIKNWDKFQHFKDRRPPWIKLYREILDQRDIMLLSDCSHRVLIGLWLLASEDPVMEGNLPSIDDISFRLRIEKSKIIKSLEELSSFVYLDDAKMLSKEYQVDAPEIEKEIEKEVEKEVEIPSSSSMKDIKFGEVSKAKSSRKIETPPGFEKFWEVYPRKVGKKAALRAYSKLKPDTDTLTNILTAVSEQSKTLWVNKEPEFIPHPATWLNSERWNDELPNKIGGLRRDFKQRW